MLFRSTAMYRAKQRGRGRAELYSEAMRAEARERVALTNALERSLAASQMRLVYQPLVSAHTGRNAGVEVLLRWDHPDRPAQRQWARDYYRTASAPSTADA